MFPGSSDLVPLKKKWILKLFLKCLFEFFGSTRHISFRAMNISQVSRIGYEIWSIRLSVVVFSTSRLGFTYRGGPRCQELWSENRGQRTRAPCHNSLNCPELAMYWTMIYARRFLDPNCSSILFSTVFAGRNPVLIISSLQAWETFGAYHKLDDWITRVILGWGKRIIKDCVWWLILKQVSSMDHKIHAQFI